MDLVGMDEKRIRDELPDQDERRDLNSPSPLTHTRTHLYRTCVYSQDKCIGDD